MIEDSAWSGAMYPRLRHLGFEIHSFLAGRAGALIANAPIVRQLRSTVRLVIGRARVRLSRDELVAAFDWAQCGRGDGKFDPKKFLAIDHDHLKSAHLTPDDVYAQRTLPSYMLVAFTT